MSKPVAEKETEWETPSPALGKGFIKPRADEIRKDLQVQASVSLAHLQDELEIKVKHLREEFGGKKAKVMKMYNTSMSMSDEQIIRKYWNGVEASFNQFISREKTND